MRMLAYASDSDSRGTIDARIPEGIDLHWLAQPEELSSQENARGLVLFSRRWPDPAIERLLKLFTPRPVVLIDMTDEGHWHNVEQPAGVRLTDLNELEDQLFQLCSPQAFSPARTLALLSARNDFDGALVAIYAAWSLKKRKSGRVLILDLGLPQSDVAAYLDLQPRIGLVDLVESRDQLDRGWLDDKEIEAVPGIDVIGLRAESGLGRISAQALTSALEALESRYDHLVFNLVGMQPSALLKLVATRCEQHWLLADQKSLSLAAAMEMAHELFEQGIRPGGVNLLLAPYSREVLPALDSIEKRIPLPLRGALPWIPQALTHINAGTLLPPPADLLPLMQAVERALWLRAPDPWWRRLTHRSA